MDNIGNHDGLYVGWTVERLKEALRTMEINHAHESECLRERAKMAEDASKMHAAECHRLSERVKKFSRVMDDLSSQMTNTQRNLNNMRTDEQSLKIIAERDLTIQQLSLKVMQLERENQQLRATLTIATTENELSRESTAKTPKTYDNAAEKIADDHAAWCEQLCNQLADTASECSKITNERDKTFSALAAERNDTLSLSRELQNQHYKIYGKFSHDPQDYKDTVPEREYKIRQRELDFKLRRLEHEMSLIQRERTLLNSDADDAIHKIKLLRGKLVGFSRDRCIIRQ